MRAMILAAGRGERMRPLTDTVPKPLLPAGGKPLILWHIERLVAAGMREIVINHAWLGDRLEAALGDGSRVGARLRYSREGTALETAGGIARALPMLGDAPFLVINGDVWCDWNPAQALELAPDIDATGRRAWLLLVDNPEHHPEGDFHLRSDGAIHPNEGQRLTFSGIGVYHPALFAAIAPGTAARLGPLLTQAIADDAVRGARHTGKWVDVGTPERLAALDAELGAAAST
ncbi:N-acetylmuramate alpha-1-phosphate uridylyltransferase MurU [Bordetella genomosp. 9]|uniref:Mannose-1-phosphate guanylyltransferase n=1 Tax=Bordetella genomosp. 9 TaxID=1416803 RepID=A0A1W6Z364_9BORD|nr:nucleotidyltransferase family protein [Bordetella genomosp. 9]ARP87614.1 mannose-1-phosphate guanylyltransferase [Bordetella genomosp. 9]